ncbi:MAG: tetratricopeptide repeat protein [Ignavibacteria bacterium]
MAIKPKYTLSGAGTDINPKAGKKFTDREEYLSAFQNALATKVKDEHKLVVYYGIGGIGKTTLRKELGKRLETEKPDTVWTAIDLDTPTYREQETALFVLRNQLHEKFKINFPSFDIAYTIYWQKTHPQTPMTKDTFPLLTGANVVAGIMRVVGEMPYIGFVPKLTKAFMTGGNVFREWWKKRGEKELANLPLLEPKEISLRMPMFWASDMKDFLEEKKKEAVLFLDTYEALWENLKADGGFFMRDEWIRELVSHLPEVLWVVCGREKLRWYEQDEEWNNYMEQYLLGRLSDEDSRYFLRSCGVGKSDVQSVIIKASKGVPHFLDLAVDTYYEIQSRHNRKPEAKDFARTQESVLERFLRYLDKTEIETLKALSSARIWGSEIFRLLVNEFHTGYPITAMDNLCRFSFINETEKPGIYTMHELMRESLQAKLDAETLKLLHRTLFDYYKEKLNSIDVKNIDDNAKQLLIEACYHGKISLTPKEYFDWYLVASKIFHEAAQYQFLLPLAEDLIKLIEDWKGNESIEYAGALRILSKNYHQLGKYKIAEPLFERVLKIQEKVLGSEHPEVADIISNLAELFSAQGKFSEAEPMFLRAIKIIGKNSGENDKIISDSLNNLAVLYSMQGRYSDAEPIIKRAIEIREKCLGTDHSEVAKTIMNLANIYFDLKKFPEAEELYQRSLAICEKTFGDTHPEVAKALNSIGNIYIEQGKYREAEPYYLRANEIFESAFGQEHPEVAVETNNLAYLYYKLGKYSEAFTLYKKALKLFQKLLGTNHPHIATIINNMAILFLRQKRYRESEILFKRALRIRIEMLGTEHQDLADSYKYFAELYEEQNRIAEAIEYLEKAQEILEKVFDKDVPDAAQISDRLEKLKSKLT